MDDNFIVIDETGKSMIKVQRVIKSSNTSSNKSPSYSQNRNQHKSIDVMFITYNRNSFLGDVLSDVRNISFQVFFTFYIKSIFLFYKRDKIFVVQTNNMLTSFKGIDFFLTKLHRVVEVEENKCWEDTFSLKTLIRFDKTLTYFR